MGNAQAAAEKTLESALQTTEMKVTAKALLIKIGEAKKEAGRAFGLIDLTLPNPSTAAAKNHCLRPAGQMILNDLRLTHPSNPQRRANCAYLQQIPLSHAPTLPDRTLWQPAQASP